jgi:hypothetical protein
MFCRLIIYCGCVLTALSVEAQNNADIKKGDACMEKGAYSRAATFYKKAANDDVMAVSANEKLGKALIALEDYQNAEKVYKSLASISPDGAINWFYYGQILRINGKYEEADKAYHAYFKAHSGDPLADEFKNFEAKVKRLLTDTSDYKLTNIPENTVGSDVEPMFCLYDMCFITNGHTSGQQKAYDLYMRRGGSETNPASPVKLKGDIKGRLNEGPATFTRNGMEMIFTRSNYKHKSADGTMKSGLYHADYDSKGKKWVNIKPLNFIDYNYDFMQPSLSKDGSMLFFASNMKGGLGESDIYVCYKHDNTWSAPVNLGSGINTMGKEETPFIADNGTLYFASDSRMGLGGLDIYGATFNDGVWGHAINLRVPLNSAYNDFGFISDPTGKSGYLISNRPGGKGGNDIYQFILMH